MKPFILCLLLSYAANSFSCEIQEAQFIGTVQNLNEFQNGTANKKCTFQIEFTMLNPSYVCPLVIGEISTVIFADDSCELKNGQAVSGILKKVDGIVEIE